LSISTTTALSRAHQEQQVVRVRLVLQAQLGIQEIQEIQETLALVARELQVTLELLVVDLLVMLVDPAEQVIMVLPVDQVTLEDQVMLVVHHSQFPLYLD
jgi:hypothetical protein